MEFWKGNRLDGKFEASPAELAPRFWASTWGDAVRYYPVREPYPASGLSLDRALRAWLSAPDGLDSVWEDAAGYDELFKAVRASWPPEQG